MDKNKVKTAVLSYLAKNKLMSLATSVQDQPWAATVFFAFDEEFNLFFMSKESTKHGQNIKQNPRVAVTINQDWGKPGFVKGIQCMGEVSIVSQDQFDKHYAFFLKRYPWASRFKEGHAVFIIKPKELYYLDHELFGHFHRVQII